MFSAALCVFHGIFHNRLHQKPQDQAFLNVFLHRYLIIKTVSHTDLENLKIFFNIIQIFRYRYSLIGVRRVVAQQFREQDHHVLSDLRCDPADETDIIQGIEEEMRTELAGKTFHLFFRHDLRQFPVLFHLPVQAADHLVESVADIFELCAAVDLQMRSEVSFRYRQKCFVQRRYILRGFYRHFLRIGQTREK